MKRKATKQAPVTVTVSLPQAVYDRLSEMCIHFGEPGVARAAMAATAVVRGLEIIATEIGFPKRGDL